MPIEAVTLDFHDTIARCDDWFALEVRELAPEALRLLAAAGHAPDDVALRDRARVAYRELRLAIIGHGEERDALACALAALAAVGVAPPEEAVAGAVERLMRDALAGATPVPGVIDAVRALRRRGLRLGVVSSAVYHPFLDWTLARFGLRDAFASVVTSASCGFYKSRPEIYHAALAELGATPATAVHVGDSYRFDVLGARRAGLRAVWYSPRGERPVEDEADATITDLAALPAALARLDVPSPRP